jgi:hypothetical protein
MTDVVPFPHTETGGELDLHEGDRRRLNALYRECMRIANSKFVPDAYKGDADTIFALARYGEQYGLAPMHSLSRLYIIQGRIEPSYDVVLGVVMSHGHEVRMEETSSERCTVALRRVDSDFWQRVTFTIADAKRAGLLDVWVEKWQSSQSGKKFKQEYVIGTLDVAGEPELKAELVDNAPGWATELIEKREFRFRDNWRRHPDDMLASKAIRRAAKRFCPDALLNLTDEGEGMPIDDLQRVDQPVSHDHDQAGDDDIVDAEIVDETGEDGTPQKGTGTDGADTEERPAATATAGDGADGQDVGRAASEPSPPAGDEGAEEPSAAVEAPEPPPPSTAEGRVEELTEQLEQSVTAAREARRAAAASPEPEEEDLEVVADEDVPLAGATFVRSFAIQVRESDDVHGRRFDDEDRHAIVAHVTEGRTRSTKEVRLSEVSDCFATLSQLVKGRFESIDIDGLRTIRPVK